MTTTSTQDKTDHPYRVPKADELVPKAPLVIPRLPPALRPSEARDGLRGAPKSVLATALGTVFVWLALPFLLDFPSDIVPLWFVLGVPVSVLMAWTVDRMVFAKRILSAFNAETVTANELASRGSAEEAEERHVALLKKFRGRPGLEALALHNVAAMRIRKGDAIGALSILYAIFDYRGTKRSPGLAMRIAGKISVTTARLGRTTEARKWLAVARAKAGKTRFYTANLEGLILAREGKYDEAESAYAAQWPDLERVCASEEMRGIRAVRAFVLEKLGKDAKTVDEMVATARGPSGGNHEAGCEEWDELRDFFVRKGLVSGPPTSSAPKAADTKE